MKVRAMISACALAFTLAFAGTVRPQVAPTQQPSEPVREGMAAPEFVVDAIDGKRVSLAEFRGRLVLLVFWSTG